MSPHPVVELLIRRWAMPRERAPLVGALLEACELGATALALSADQAGQDWGKALVRVGVSPAATPLSEAPTPLVLVSHAGTYHLQTWAHHASERAIATSLRARIQASLSDAPEVPGTLKARAEALFASPNGDTTALAENRQYQAALMALVHRFALITGGPGTGKTTTLARILALLIEAAGPAARPRITLAAPTGKAADRMREAVEKAVAELGPRLEGSGPALLDAARSAATLHRLLGYNPSTASCRHHAGNPLPVDILVVDEASMIDVSLWRALLDAVPARARMIVLGDPAQLESVAAGRVLADMVAASDDDDSILAHCSIHLERSFRFERRKDIAALATHIGFGNADGVQSLLESRRDAEAPDGVCWLGEARGGPSWEQLPPKVRDAIVAISQAPDANTALQALSRVCILSAYREHPHGALGISEMIQRRLATQSPAATRNHPVIINHNDPETGLSNGTVGVITQSPGELPQAWFPASDRNSPPRCLPLGKLPEHSPAWALTIHRSQGSEYDHVLVVLPRGDSPLATRELIYTAITRARENVYLLGPLDSIRSAVTSDRLRLTCLRPLLGVA